MQKWWLDFAVKLQFFKPGLLHIFQSDSMLSEFLHFFQAICFRSLAFYGSKLKQRTICIVNYIFIALFETRLKGFGSNWSRFIAYVCCMFLLIAQLINDASLRTWGGSSLTIKTRPHNSLFDLAWGLGTVNKHLSLILLHTFPFKPKRSTHKSHAWISKRAMRMEKITFDWQISGPPSIIPPTACSNGRSHTG